MKNKNAETLRAIRPSKALELAYRKKLLRLIDKMQASVLYWLSAEYRQQEPDIVANDETPSVQLQRAIRKRMKQWINRFERESRDLAEWFTRQAYKYTDNAFKDAWKSFKAQKWKSKQDELGFTVKFKITPQMRNVLKGFVNQNVSLIRSIPEKYFTEVEGMVMRSATSGRDLSYLTENLKERYGITRRRAEFIARDQNNKATSQINRTRQLDLGITKAIWKHSGGVRHPRKSHEAADGKIYDLATGLKVDGEYIFPGELCNCGCYSVPVLEEFE